MLFFHYTGDWSRQLRKTRTHGHYCESNYELAESESLAESDATPNNESAASNEKDEAADHVNENLSPRRYWSFGAGRSTYFLCVLAL